MSNELTGEKLWRKCRQLSKSVANPDKRKGVTIVKNGTAIATELGSVDKLIGLQSEFIQYSREKEATELGIDKIIGMFNAETILQMGAAQLVRVMANHNFMIGWTNPSTETRCNSDMIFRCISRGINKVLGPGSDHLIYKTLQSVYKMKIEDIESRPDILAVKLVKLLANSAETVLRSIANELQTEIFALTE